MEHNRIAELWSDIKKTWRDRGCAKKDICISPYGYSYDRGCIPNLTRCGMFTHSLTRPTIYLRRATENDTWKHYTLLWVNHMSKQIVEIYYPSSRPSFCSETLSTGVCQVNQCAACIAWKDETKLAIRMSLLSSGYLVDINSKQRHFVIGSPLDHWASCIDFFYLLGVRKSEGSMMEPSIWYRLRYRFFFTFIST